MFPLLRKGECPINNKIKEYRKKLGYTQKEIADILNIDRSTYAYYELGRIKPDINCIIKLCKIFNIRLEEILSEDTNLPNTLHDNPIFDFKNNKNTPTYILTKKEQELISYYRMLSPEKKKEIKDEIIKKCGIKEKTDI